MLTHSSVCANVQQISHPGAMRAIVATGKKILKLLLSIGFAYGKINVGNGADAFQEVNICILPFFHVYGMISLLLTGLDHGAKLVTLPRFESDSFLNSLNQHHVRSRVTLFCDVGYLRSSFPSFFYILANRTPNCSSGSVIPRAPSWRQA